MAKKRRKPKGLLADQRPKRRWGLHSRFWKYSAFVIFGAAIGFPIYRLVQHNNLSLLTREDERPQLQPSKDLSIEDQARIRDAYRRLNRVSPETLEVLARDLHQTMGLRSINVIQTSPFQIAIATEPFVASYIVELDRLRYVTEDGIVFGQVNEGEVSTLPILKGLDRKAPSVRSRNGTIIPSAGNQRIIEDTLLAIQEGKRYNIQYRSLMYDDFLGLMGELQEPAYRITLGFKPFDIKYLKLEKILADFKERGFTSATIELDYKGKAFVKGTAL